MDIEKTESARYVRPTASPDVFSKPLISTESNRSLKTMKPGISLASVRRNINKNISGGISEALKEEKNLEEVWEYSSDFYPNSPKESIPSFKFVSKQISRLTPPKSNRNSLLTGDASTGGKINISRYYGSFISDVERLTSVLNVATKFVDSILSEAYRTLSETDQSKNETVQHVPLKDLCFKSEEAERDRPSVFNLATNFVDSILNESMRRTTNLKVIGIERLRTYHSLDDFKVKDGLEIVAKCISTWSFNHNWFHRTLYHGRMITDESHSYFYTVLWSVPTPSYPVAQVTVDVNFTVEVIPLKTSPFYIEVWYRIETDRSQHSAFNTKFLEKWLNTVVKRKLQAFKMFKF